MKNNILKVLDEARKALEALLATRPRVIAIIADPDDPETVDLIASGYEWTCPTCDKENREVEATEQVTCKRCGKAYEANPPEHAYSS